MYMDPTQNKDSFDSFGPGGNNTGGPVGGQAVNSAMPVGGFRQAGVNPMISNAPNQMNSFGPATEGDIVLNDGSAQKQSRIPIVILAVLIVAVIVVVIVVLIITQGSKGGGVSATDEREAFNSYANYILHGTESKEDLDEETIKYSEPYFEQLKTNELSNYLEMAEKKYDTFYKIYAINGNRNSAMRDLANYYQKFASIIPLTTSEIIDTYYDNGAIAVNNLINSRYKVIEMNESGVSAYVRALERKDRFIMQIAEAADLAGCIISEKFTSSCYDLNDSQRQVMVENEKDVINYSWNISDSAWLALNSIYNNVYDTGRVMGGALDLDISITDEENNSQGGEDGK